MNDGEDGRAIGSVILIRDAEDSRSESVLSFLFSVSSLRSLRLCGESYPEEPAR
jgi:hypothetical protein